MWSRRASTRGAAVLAGLTLGIAAVATDLRPSVPSLESSRLRPPDPGPSATREPTIAHPDAEAAILRPTENDTPPTPPSPTLLSEPSKPAVILSGHVVSAIDERPIAAAQVKVEAPGVLERGITDPEGRFLVEVESSSPLLRLTAAAPGHGPAGLSIRPRDPQVPSIRIALSREAKLRGRVVEWDGGAPVPGATILFAHGGGVTSGRADGHGFFEIDGVGEGRAVLRATAPGHLDSSRQVLGLDGSSDGEIEIRLSRIHELAGRVVSEGGTPLAGVSVSLVPRVEDAAHLLRAVTDPDGFFLVEPRERADTYDVLLERDGMRRSFADVAWESLAGPVPLDLRFGHRGSRLRLLVFAPDGKVASGVSLTLAPLEAGEGLFHSARTRRHTTDGNGVVEIKGIDEGTWILVAQARGAAPAVFGPIELAGEEVREHVVRLERGRTLAIHVVDSEGEPLEGARVIVVSRELDLPSPWSERTDGSGTARFGDLADGRYGVHVSVSGLRHSPWTWLEVSEGTSLVEVTFREPASVIGRLLDSGEPVERFVIELERTDEERGRRSGRLSFSPATGGGIFRLGGLEPGVYRFRARAPGRPAWIREHLELPPGGLVDLGPIDVRE